MGFPGGSDSKESACSAGDRGLIPGSDPWVRKILWRKKWLHTPVFLLREFHGQRSLEGYSPWGHKIRHDWATNRHPCSTKGMTDITRKLLEKGSPAGQLFTVSVFPIANWIIFMGIPNHNGFLRRSPSGYHFTSLSELHRVWKTKLP